MENSYSKMFDGTIRQNYLRNFDQQLSYWVQFNGCFPTKKRYQYLSGQSAYDSGMEYLPKKGKEWCRGWIEAQNEHRECQLLLEEYVELDYSEGW